MQYFVALADKRSFSKAAAQCHVTQSTLSAAIRAFEEALDSELVDRSGRGVVLTEAGEAVLDRVRCSSPTSRRSPAWRSRRPCSPARCASASSPRSRRSFCCRAPCRRCGRASRPEAAAPRGADPHLGRDLRPDGSMPSWSPTVWNRGLETASVGFDRFLFAASRRHPLAGATAFAAPTSPRNRFCSSKTAIACASTCSAPRAQPRARDDIEASSRDSRPSSRWWTTASASRCCRASPSTAASPRNPTVARSVVDERAARELVLVRGVAKRSNRSEEFPGARAPPRPVSSRRWSRTG